MQHNQFPQQQAQSQPHTPVVSALRSLLLQQQQDGRSSLHLHHQPNAAAAAAAAAEEAEAAAHSAALHAVAGAGGAGRGGSSSSMQLAALQQRPRVFTPFAGAPVGSGPWGSSLAMPTPHYAHLHPHPHQQQQQQQQQQQSHMSAGTTATAPATATATAAAAAAAAAAARCTPAGLASSNATLRMTVQLVATYTKCARGDGADGGVPRPLPRRVLTMPAVAARNDGWDNAAYDLILSTQVRVAC
jgi:hypothetical protein